MTTRGGERDKEGKRVETERRVCLMFKLAAVALPIDANPYNHNAPMQEHSWCLRDTVASSSIFCKISMEITDRRISVTFGSEFKCT
jgi:hypothetical protein